MEHEGHQDRHAHQHRLSQQVGRRCVQQCSEEHLLQVVLVDSVRSCHQHDRQRKHPDQEEADGRLAGER